MSYNFQLALVTVFDLNQLLCLSEGVLTVHNILAQTIQLPGYISSLWIIHSLKLCVIVVEISILCNHEDSDNLSYKNLPESLKQLRLL